ncbi:MAG: phosphopantothenoylcysteine decarboxylase domain-containing protein [Pirellulaceae bacterium]
MARILITSGPTRQYIDPVRYLTNASSGRMGCALTAAALERGHEVIVVSGPVTIQYPAMARVVSVVSTEEMLAACCREFCTCDGVIASAAPCDYRPQHVAREKISKTGQPLLLQLLETPDIVAALGADKRPEQWAVGFALETTDQRIRAQLKLEKKSCDLIVLNGPGAIDSETNAVEVINPRGQIVRSLEGSKTLVAHGILEIIQRQLIDRS